MINYNTDPNFSYQELLSISIVNLKAGGFFTLPENTKIKIIWTKMMKGTGEEYSSVCVSRIHNARKTYLQLDYQINEMYVTDQKLLIRNDNSWQFVYNEFAPPYFKIFLQQDGLFAQGRGIAKPYSRKRKYKTFMEKNVREYKNGVPLNYFKPSFIGRETPHIITLEEEFTKGRRIEKDPYDVLLRKAGDEQRRLKKFEKDYAKLSKKFYGKVKP